MSSRPPVLLARSAVLRAGLALAALAGAPHALPVQELALDAGPDRVVLPPATSIELAASLRAPHVPDHPSVRVRWVRFSGPPVTLEGADTLTPTVVPARPGVVHLRLEATHPLAGRATDDVVLHFFGAGQSGELTGPTRKWHKLALTFTHDTVLSETSATNPFLDVRLLVHFHHPESGAFVTVPGFFAADGNAAETGAEAGTRWRVNFTPDRVGTWHYVASFEEGRALALAPSATFGRPLSFDGASGSFRVAPADPSAPGFLAKGRLEYVGAHHTRFAETRAHFLKTGAGSPENLLGYYEFDGTFDQGGVVNALNNSGAFDGLHHFGAHLADYVDRGVPTWHGTKGRRLFGALSFLASRGVNSLYTVTFNVDGGDGREVWPWSPSSDKLRFDVSKLAQWERMLDHMTREGIVWHVVTQETENDQALDGGELGVERKLYYRELVARFGHALGLVWNLGEENTNTTEERKAFADYIHALDPYDHPITIHNVVGDLFTMLTPLLGTHLEQVSIQGDPVNTPPRLRQIVSDSAASGRPWVVNFDEQAPASEGVVPDTVDFWHDLIRRESLWPTLLGQGGGCEWYFGFGHPNTDLDCENFRSRENMFRLAARAREFVQSHVRFQEMEHADALADGSDPSVLAKPGEAYLVYLPFGGNVTLQLGNSHETFLVDWFDARNGGPLQSGAVTQVTGPGVVALGGPPGPGDWCAFVRRATNLPPVLDLVDTEPTRVAVGDAFAIRAYARDPNGPTDRLRVSAQLRDPSGAIVGSVPLARRGGDLHSFYLRSVPIRIPGTWHVLVTARDSGGLTATAATTFEIP